MQEYNLYLFNNKNGYKNEDDSLNNELQKESFWMGKELTFNLDKYKSTIWMLLIIARGWVANDTAACMYVLSGINSASGYMSCNKIFGGTYAPTISLVDSNTFKITSSDENGCKAWIVPFS